MSKKIITIVIVLVFTLTSTTLVFASSNKKGLSQSPAIKGLVKELIKGDITNAQTEEVASDLEALQLAGFDSDIITGIDIQKNKDNIYTLKLNDEITSEISINDSGKNLIYTITEGNLTNVVELTDDNRILVDGDEVTLNMENKNSHLVVGSDTSSWTTAKCPYGKSADYSKYIGKKQDGDVSVTKKLKSLAAATLATIIGLISPLAGAATAMAVAIKELFSPNTSHLSFKNNRYIHKKGNPVRGTLSVTENNITWWEKTYYNGKKLKKKTYSCIERY